MMNAGEVSMKERILMIRMSYFVLKEEMKYDECGWSNCRPIRSAYQPPAISQQYFSLRTNPNEQAVYALPCKCTTIHESRQKLALRHGRTRTEFSDCAWIGELACTTQLVL
jgi:hypothetical protein